MIGGNSCVYHKGGVLWNFFLIKSDIHVSISSRTFCWIWVKVPRLAETDDRLAQISCMYIYISTLMQLLEGITFAYRYVYFELHNFSYIDINIWSAPHSKTKLNFQKNFKNFAQYFAHIRITRDSVRVIKIESSFRWLIFSRATGRETFEIFEWCANHHFWHSRGFKDTLASSFKIRVLLYENARNWKRTLWWS